MGTAVRALSLLAFATGCRGFMSQSSHNRVATSRYETTTSLKALSFLDFLKPPSVQEEDRGISKSTDPEYPQFFTGRLWFSPSLVKVEKDPVSGPGSDVSILSLFGYSLGGTVALEYDTSPVGPYREYVTMSALVTKRGAIGQWGSRLYVSTQKAEDVCKDIWGVPAELADIDFCEKSSSSLQVTSPPKPNAPSKNVQNICVQGWENTRVLTSDEYNDNTKRWGGIPVFWTPTIKALWAPLIPFSGREENTLPLHKLRLSASGIRLRWSGFNRNIENDDFSEAKYNLGIPLGMGLVVDNVKIEIGTRCADNL